jgi:hypothetical protein
MQIVLVITGYQAEMGVLQRLAIVAIEHAYGDGLIVDDRKGLCRSDNGGR